MLNACKFSKNDVTLQVNNLQYYNNMYKKPLRVVNIRFGETVTCDGMTAVF